MSVAKQNSGRIVFEETRKIEISLNTEMSEEMKSMIPSSQVSQKLLLFNEAASIYEDYEKDDSGGDGTWNATSEGGGGVRIMIAKPDDKVYRNLSNGELTEKREFMGKIFLVQGSVEKPNWKFTGKSKDILGYMCQQATIEDSTGVTEAWFTPQIVASSGPANYGGLPGMVLEVSSNESKHLITAKDIVLVEIAATEIKEPKKGKKVNREEYEAIVREKMAEMKEMSGGEMKFIMKH